MKKHILVTGGTGLVGQYLQKIMPEAVYSDSSRCDFTNQDKAEDYIYRHKPHTIVHLAAKAGGMYDNIKYPADYLEQNILINTNVLRAALRNKVQRFIGISSTCVYPDYPSDDYYPITEEWINDGMPSPSVVPYATAKRAMSVLIDQYNKQHGTKYQYLIPCNMFGTETRTTDPEKLHFVNAMIAKVIKAQKSGKTSIELFGTGKPLRQFIWAYDLAIVIKECIDRDITESFNIAPDKSLSIDQIAKNVLTACGATDFKITYNTSKKDGQFRKCASNRKMKSLLPDFEFTPMKPAIRKTYNATKGKI